MSKTKNESCDSDSKKLIKTTQEQLILFFNKLKEYQTISKYAPNSSKCKELYKECLDLRDKICQEFDDVKKLKNHQ